MNNSQRIWNALQSNDVNTVIYLNCNKLNALMAHKPDDVTVWDITKATEIKQRFMQAIGNQ